MVLYGLIGTRLSHSFSSRYFHEKFLKQGLSDSFAYRNFELKSIHDLPALISENEQLAGLNVTIPFKEQVIPFLDTIDPVALEAGAVNTIRINRSASGKISLAGFNTDITGFEKAFLPLLLPSDSGVLILGSGGGAKAVSYALRRNQIPFRVVSRDPGRGITIDKINEELLRDFPVIVNTTPVGTFPDIDTFPPFPYSLLQSNNFLFDLIYNPPVTAFLKAGIRAGCRTENGHRMLILQAEDAWSIWQS